MRRQIALIILVLIILALPGIVLAQELKVEITSPEVGEELRGIVPIIGSASVPSFQYYKVEFGVGASPSEWALIGDLHQQPILNSQLDVWDTRALPDGVYTLRLQGVKQDGNWHEFFVRNVVIANTRPTSTPEPTDTPVAESKPTPTLISTPTPQATSTPMIIAPTKELSRTTPTPTLSAPARESDLPIDLDALGQSAMYGAAAMFAVFVLLGIVFGLRKLL